MSVDRMTWPELRVDQPKMGTWWVITVDWILTHEAKVLDDENISELASQLQSAKVVFSDLDNTLIQSKYPMTDEMADAFAELLKEKKVVIVTGGMIETIQKNVIARLKDICGESQLQNLVLLPLVWNETWEYDVDQWTYVKTREIKESVIWKGHIQILEEALNKALDEFGRPEVDFKVKDVVEKRWEGTVKFIAMSYFGQNVPQEYADTKDGWDPDRTKRDRIIELIYKHIDPRFKKWWEFGDMFEFKTGWSSSIDITVRWFDKASGLEQYFKYDEWLERDDTIFLWDSFWEGWNDAPALNAWVRWIDVWNESQATKLLQLVTS